MAIDWTPLLGVQPMPAMNSGVEVYTAEVHNVFAGTCVGCQPSDLEFRALSVLINFSTDIQDRSALRSLLSDLPYARVAASIFEADWPLRVHERLSELQPAFVAAVIYIDAETFMVAETIRSAVEILEGAFGSNLAATVIVAGNCAGSLIPQGTAGFVQGSIHTTGTTARQLFLMLSSLIAPKTLNGIDVIDLYSVQGTAERPSTIVEAVWSRTEFGRLAFARDEDRELIRSSNRILAMPISCGLDWNVLREFRLGLCANMRRDAHLTVWATTSEMQPRPVTEAFEFMLAICSQ